MSDAQTTDAVDEAVAAGLLFRKLALELRLMMVETGWPASACADFAWAARVGCSVLAIVRAKHLAGVFGALRAEAEVSR